jgi:rSAM/selenodomain-associated transferase 1
MDRLLSSDGTILLFLKSPEKGRVKSRLASALGEERTLHIYKSFALDIIGTLKKRDQPLKICFYPHDSKETVVSWLGEDVSYLPQKGEDLGERMENAFIQIFSEGIEKAVLIGSDIPDLANTVIDEAFSSLERNGAVIGPASDGGYYLIGFRKNSFFSDIFHGISWSAGSVFQKTMKIFRRAGFRVHVLPEWNDVDTLDDLRSLFIRNINTEFRESRSMSLCREIFCGENFFLIN